MGQDGGGGGGLEEEERVVYGPQNFQKEIFQDALFLIFFEQYATKKYSRCKVQKLLHSATNFKITQGSTRSNDKVCTFSTCKMYSIICPNP